MLLGMMRIAFEIEIVVERQRAIGTPLNASANAA